MQVSELRKNSTLRFDGVEKFVDPFFLNTMKSIKLSYIYDTLFKSIDLKDEFLRFEAFNNGSQFSFSFEHLKKSLKKNGLTGVKSINGSLRVTNVQKIFPEIKKITLKLYEHYTVPVSCNLYITAHKDSNCFIYHSDFQETIIYQSCGSKQWYFPKDEDGKFERKANFREAKESFGNVQKITVHSGDAFCFDHSLIHKAELVGDNVSVHFTFAILSPNELSLVKDIIDEVLPSGDVEFLTKNILNRDISYEQSFEKIIKKFSKLNQEKFLKKIMEKHEKREMMILKKGRSY